MVEVLSTFNQGDVAIAKSLLDGQGIDYYAQAELFNLVRPWVVPVRFVVRADQAPAAREILAEGDWGYWSISAARGTWQRAVVYAFAVYNAAAWLIVALNTAYSLWREFFPRSA